MGINAKEFEMERAKKLWRLFIITFFVSSTTSGGHAITAVLKPYFVGKYKWLTSEEFTDLVSVGQIIPGSIAINVCVVLGYRIAGLVGALVAMIGTTIPPFGFMLIVSIIYEAIAKNVYVGYFMEGMQTAVIGLLLCVTINTFKESRQYSNWFGYSIMVVSFIYAMFTNWSIVYLFVLVLLASFIRTRILSRYLK